MRAVVIKADPDWSPRVIDPTLPAAQLEALQDETDDDEDISNAMNSRTAARASSASADWGTPELARRFAAAVMRPAAHGRSALDLDASTSVYWQSQWAASDRPLDYFDGSPGRDILSIPDWLAMIGKLGEIGSVFENAPGDVKGAMVQRCWQMLEAMYGCEVLGSLFWTGFALEQLRTLIPDEEERDGSREETNPRGVRPARVDVAAAKRANVPVVEQLQAWLDRGPLLSPLDQRVCTIFPGKRISYMVKPDDMISLIDKRMKKCKSTSEMNRMIERRKNLVNRSDDSPVSGPSPTCSSYFSILWHRNKKIRNAQQAAMRSFLDAQAGVPKSPLERVRVIGCVS